MDGGRNTSREEEEGESAFLNREKKKKKKEWMEEEGIAACYNSHMKMKENTKYVKRSGWTI